LRRRSWSHELFAQTLGARVCDQLANAGNQADRIHLEGTEQVQNYRIALNVVNNKRAIEIKVFEFENVLAY